MDQAHQRLLWTGAAANGALLLGLIGFAGSADDPMAALRTITLPTIGGIAGFIFGGAAIIYGVRHLTQRPLEAIAKAKIAMSHRYNEAFKDVLTTPAIDPEVARLVWGDQADEQIRALILGRLTVAQDQTEKSPALFDEAILALKMSATEGIAHMRAAQRWLIASFAAAALGVVVLVGQAWMITEPKTSADAARAPVAAKPAPPTAPVAALLAPVALPACLGGAPDCQPWERTWDQSPPVGAVVPGRVQPSK